MGCEIGRIRPTNVFERAGESRMTPPASSSSSQVRPRISFLRQQAVVRRRRLDRSSRDPGPMPPNLRRAHHALEAPHDQTPTISILALGADPPSSWCALPRPPAVVSCPWFGLYVHWFQTSDDDCLHDHPWPYLTIILRGGYWEVTPGPGRDRATVSRCRWYGPGSVRVRPARWLHRITIDPAHKPVTLVLRGRVGRAWGFKTRAGWISWRAYTQLPPP